jgi:AcrR family transcriptional regulator
MASDAHPSTAPDDAVLEPVRLARADRREDLLDAALDLVASGDVDGVSVESVADRAGVSRALVYKHFANRTEILTALYEREGTRLHNELSADVISARTLEDKYRALCHGSLAAARARGQIFEGLRSAAGRNRDLRRVQRDRDRVTAAAYVRETVRELGVAQAVAEPVTLLLLGAIAPMLNAWHANPSEEYAAELEEAYMCIVSGTLAAMSRATASGKRRRRLRATAETAESGPAASQPVADETSTWLVQQLQHASPDLLRDVLATVVSHATGTQHADRAGTSRRDRSGG